MDAISEWISIILSGCRGHTVLTGYHGLRRWLAPIWDPECFFRGLYAGRDGIQMRCCYARVPTKRLRISLLF